MSTLQLASDDGEDAKPDVRVETVTPEMARKYLGFNTHNRSLRQRVVEAYAADMRSGDWQWNGESIKFAVNGALLDGQHRLAAVIEADLPVPMLVVRGLPNSTQETMDGGAKRKFGDVLKLRGELNYVCLATTVRAVTAWRAGERGSVSTYTNAQMLQTLDTIPWLRDVALMASRAQQTSGLPVSVGGVLFYLASALDSDDAENFFLRLCSAENHKAGDPIFALRRFLSTTVNVRGEKDKRYIAAVAIKAWNAYRAGEPVMQLKFRPGGATPERFPEPK